ncbi:type II toxin-antitoxin system VapC family toxin [Rhizobium rhizogenes]|uniref:type II toxin-antitoxin system VapC family toxin n=1 Tax=Rhizobium rhizogenes TaxID=359 RepID=UPI0015748768|nr:type II toxin-antitoxin system VapC family toxin [Rhizobium rhizogenes]NTG64726.1 type II toxin-antitoxin system VapC family toxin [Rhizobium rhizogenes]NTH68451.1 type II toxin-antitoxin system VapC family toxin [Rhizobium rhizogenes]NTH99928.1 type II toxin-antitoxin system VapC family toxin [Rhizobium rhizogenes]NTI39080.1 type II toxin-antitoxin system VapC family toxin [Rhizobium rhizogenes]NTJ18220.1 type II toxin-antitoxin system VapC family toxin [Rhizobium rhizogenes]
MIVLDTNVISELWKAEPDPNVLAWIDAQMVETLYLSTITIAELRFGLATMPEGKRRTIYQDRLEREVLPAFSGRVLPFDLDASQAYAKLMAQAKEAGKAIGKADGYIAATAAARGLTVATRDTSPFEAAGLNVINPWDTSQ